jgi:hypothetical protein
MIHITMEFATLQDAAEAFARFNQAPSAYAPRVAAADAVPAPAGETENAASGKPRRSRQAAAPDAAAPAATPSTEASDEPQGSTSEAAGSATIAGEPDGAASVEITKEEAEAKFVGEVRPAMSEVMAKLGSDAARQFLADFQKVELAKSKLSDTPPARYDELIQACEKKLAE